MAAGRPGPVETLSVRTWYRARPWKSITEASHDARPRGCGARHWYLAAKGWMIRRLRGFLPIIKVPRANNCRRIARRNDLGWTWSRQSAFEGVGSAHAAPKSRIALYRAPSLGAAARLPGPTAKAGNRRRDVAWEAT